MGVSDTWLPRCNAKWTVSSMRSRNVCRVNCPHSVLTLWLCLNSMECSCIERYSMRSAIVPMFRPCRSANASSCGRRAMVPSSFIISTMTAAGARPAKRAKSTPASVCPARRKTPPGLATNGKMWPGCRMSLWLAWMATAFRMVWDRWAALMPGPTCSVASIETVKLVSC